MEEVKDVSVLITARNEEFLARTVEGVLANRRENTEVIIVCDGSLPNPPVSDHPDVIIIYHPVSIGQRAAINQCAKLSRATYVMKLDAHCIVDEGFDVKLMADCKPDWTVIPAQYNLHAFDWVCTKCKDRLCQCPTPEKCAKCGGSMVREIIWKPRFNRRTEFWRFDQDLHFQYWSDFKKRPEGQGDICDTMSNLGACFFMERKRFWDIDGLDEEHGSWGQMGTEISCKSWLSGGRQVVNKKTWFSHLFRTQGGDFGFPYPISGKQVDHARKHSKNLWKNGTWKKAKYPLSWLVAKFAPVPGWDTQPQSKGIIYYTDNQLNLNIAHAVQKRLKQVKLPIVSASLKPMQFGTNVHLSLKRGYLTMFKQMLSALEASTAEIVFFTEHDVLYHPSHFEFVPPKKDVFYYNENVWKVDTTSGKAVQYDCKQVSGLCCYRELALQHYRKRVALVEKQGFTQRMGFEPGTHTRPERVDDFKAEGWKSPYPNIDLRHTGNLTPSRWSKEQFRDQRNCQNWHEGHVSSIPGWNVQEIPLVTLP